MKKVFLLLLITVTHVCKANCDGQNFNIEISKSNYYDETASLLATKIYNLMNEGNYESVRGYFTSEMKGALTATKMKEAWIAPQFQFGKIISFSKPDITEIQGYKTAIIHIVYEKGKADFEIDFNESNLIVGLWMKPAQ